jgi:acyl-CoA thioesterase YciA
MELLSTHLIKKSDIGFNGNLFGGTLLSWVDDCSGAYAMQLCDTPRMVTVSIDKCNFEKPSKEGQVIKIYGKPIDIGNSSMSMYIECRSHNVRTGRQNIILKTNIKFVYIDEEGNPIPLKEKSRNRITKMLEELK